MNLTYVELFAGAGGMSLGLEMAGWRCVAHAEIEPHARAVLRHHWPDVPLYGDVSQLDGRQFKGVTMLTGGSPCQDLSIAGKRAGMADGTRSSLFFEQIRIWEEMEAPLIFWENVYGAFSSQDGRDFAAVLSAIVGAAVPVPADGWRGAGVASGPAGVAAWRTLDAQYFGVPQRRRRVFVLGVRGGGVDPAEILSLAESLSGHFAPSGEARKNPATDAGTGPAKPSVWPIDTRNATRTTDKDEQNRQGSGIGQDGDPSPTLTGLFTPAVVAFNWQSAGDVRINPMENKAHPLQAHQVQAVIAIPLQNPTMAGKAQNGLGIGQAGDPMYSLESVGHGVVMLRNREGKPGGGKGPLLSPEKSLTLGTTNDQVLFAGVPRRLTPVECERLMGWPDQHTAHGVNEKGRAYDLPDTARYKLCGNGIASPVTAWIGFQLRAAVEAID